MTKNLETLTFMEVVSLIVEKKAIIKNYGEGVGRLLVYEDKIYYQNKNRFYRIDKHLREQ
ncbi:MAG: hypothetical protein AABY22_29625 [Nanoarchaeota archaeon]